MKTLIHYAAGIIFSLCLMVTLLITSVEAVVYWTPGYFEKEYAKYNVTEAVDMTMEDLLDVTDQMMAYLRGKRADLHVDTTMGGVSREFFNEREIAHMEDVRGLFLDALAIRRGCLLLMTLCIIILFLLKADFKRVFPKSVCLGTGLFFGITAILAAIISTDFLEIFHHVPSHLFPQRFMDSGPCHRYADQYRTGGIFQRHGAPYWNHLLSLCRYCLRSGPLFP